MEQYQKIYLYKRVVKAKLYIDSHFTEEIDLDNIADQAHFFCLGISDGIGNFFSRASEE